jgi:protein-S-isoprenylcysteine O-methyltransferase Ste14
MTASRNPLVHVPPPIWYLAAFVIAWLLQRRIPLDMAHERSSVRDLIAGVLVGVGVAVATNAVVLMRRAKTTVIPSGQPTALVTGGVYRLSRNPMYVALTLVYLGAALTMNAWWFFLVIPIPLLVVSLVFIPFEERALAARFGRDYAEYGQHVRRWL